MSIWGRKSQRVRVISCYSNASDASPVCCIYHKPKRFDESSDESDCSDNEHRHASNCNLNKYDNPSHTSHRHGASKDKDTA